MHKACYFTGIAGYAFGMGSAWLGDVRAGVLIVCAMSALALALFALMRKKQYRQRPAAPR